MCLCFSAGQVRSDAVFEAWWEVACFCTCKLIISELILFSKPAHCHSPGKGCSPGANLPRNPGLRAALIVNPLNITNLLIWCTTSYTCWTRLHQPSISCFIMHVRHMTAVDTPSPQLSSLLHPAYRWQCCLSVLNTELHLGLISQQTV